jgi:hypothetical protein
MAIGEYVVHCINRPCGHSYAFDCTCQKTTGYVWTGTHNGLCYCRGWGDPHPFHGSPMTAGQLTSPAYVGKHRREEEDVD